MVEKTEGSLQSASEQERKLVIEHILRYELYRHRDISERLSELLLIDSDPNAFNRSTWDILYFLMQSYLQGFTPNVTDIYIATNLSKGTAISGLAELERRGAVRKVQDDEDARRRRIDISDKVADTLEYFITECWQRLGQPFDARRALSPDAFLVFGQSQEPLINLLNQLSHQMRTPLTAIVGFSEMIADQSLGPVHPAGYAEYARDIRSAASHLLDSMNTLVDTTLAEYGIDIPLGRLTSIDIEEIVDRTCRAAAGTAERRGITLRRKWGSTKGLVTGDQERLTQGIRLLIEATIDTTRRGHTIDVETAFDKDSGLTLRVISPTPHKLDEQPNSARTFGAPGQDGLLKGMPLISAIIHAHDGKVTVFEDGIRRYVTQIDLPIEGAIERPADPV